MKRLCLHRTIESGHGAMGDRYDCRCCSWKSYSLPINPLWWLLRLVGLARVVGRNDK